MLLHLTNKESRNFGFKSNVICASENEIRSRAKGRYEEGYLE